MEFDFRYYVQRFGKFLSSMVMPNIGAFLAWGLITAFFIPTGWIPNERLAELVGPMIVYLLPLLIGFTGGKLVHGVRGGVLGAIATAGVIVGADIPMFLGAMIIGPFAGYLIKMFDKAIDEKIPTGFEMLVNNFSAGIIGAALAILGLLIVGPVVETFSNGLGGLVESFVETGFLPLASLLIEPAKILFLNNAINHGVLGPLGIDQAADMGKSIFFLLETNPGPGLGVLVAFMLFGKGAAKSSSPGAIIIHFLGGIHEVYFPYVLMKPIMLLAVIAGGATGVLVFDILDIGLVATPSPGSIFALAAMTPKGDFFGMFLGVLAAAGVSFALASLFLKWEKNLDEETDTFEAAKQTVADLKQRIVQKIAFACDAGMGSSAMGASALRNKFKKAGVEVNVVHCSLEDIPSDVQLVVTHKDLATRARKQAPKAEIVAIENYVGAPEYDQLVDRLKK
jgi:PTS system mannitol-specific IIC component